MSVYTVNTIVQNKKPTTALRHYLIITAVGQQRPETIASIARACTQCGCNILTVKSNMLGSELAMTLFVEGNWGAIAKIETTLPALEKRLGLKLCNRRTQEQSAPIQAMSYTIQVTAMDTAGILLGLTEFLYQLSIPIEEITGHTYLTHTGTRMVSMSIKINIPNTIHLASLREQFMTYCDDQNLDAFLEPVRG